MKKNKPALFTGLVLLLLFIAVRSYSFIETGRQQLIVVYNVPRHRAIDFISGHHYYFSGDKEVTANDSLQNVHLGPCRLLHRATSTNGLASLTAYNGGIIFCHKKIMVIDDRFDFRNTPEKIRANVVILSQNPHLSVTDLAKTIDFRQLVIDASNPPWKVNKWKAEAANLRLSCFSVVDNGAFVMKLR